MLKDSMFNVDIDEQDWEEVSSDEHSSEESDLNCSLDAEMEGNMVGILIL